MKHQVVMDVSELEEIKAVQFDNGKKKGWQECIIQLRTMLQQQGVTQVKSVVSTAMYDQLLSVADLISEEGKAAPRAQVIHRRTRAPQQEARMEEKSA